MPSLPPLDIKHKINHAPHVVLLGAGASLAAFPAGDANGCRLPLMRNLVEVVGLGDLLAAHGVYENHEDFEALYDGLATANAMGSTLRARSIEDKATIARELENKVWPLLASGQVKPQIFKTFPLNEAAQAHSLMESSTHIGKIMLVTAAFDALEISFRTEHALD